MIMLFFKILFDQKGVLRNLPSRLPQQTGGLQTSDLIKLLIAKQTKGVDLAEKKEFETFKAGLKKDQTTKTVTTTDEPVGLGEAIQAQNILGLTPETAAATEKFKGLTEQEEVGTGPLGPLGFLRALVTGGAPFRKETKFTPEAEAIRGQAKALSVKSRKLKKQTKITKKITGDATIDKTGKVEDFTSDEEALITENLAAFPDKTRDEIISALRARKFIK